MNYQYIEEEALWAIYSTRRETPNPRLEYNDYNTLNRYHHVTCDLPSSQHLLQQAFVLHTPGNKHHDLP